MFRNQYDTDATTFSPAGRLFQVEYAMEAVKQGAGTVGVRSKDFAVIASLKRSPSPLASYQQKVFKIDDHIGIGISGLVSDARVVAKYMQTESLNHRFVYDAPIQTSRLVTQVADKAQRYTQTSEKRPYGVGLLIVGYDKTGAHLYQTMPSGAFFDYHAQAMGARSQGAKTYLEKVYETFEDMGLEDLIRHALTALKSTSPKPLTAKSVAVGFVGKNKPFTILEDEKVRPYVLAISDDAAAVDDEKRNVVRTSSEITPTSPGIGLVRTASGGTAAAASSSSAGSSSSDSRDEDGDVEM